MSIPPADPADVAEQRVAAGPEVEGTVPDLAGFDLHLDDLPLDADAADVVEQRAAVPVEDEDRRG